MEDSIFSYEKLGDVLICTMSPPDWVGSQIQIVVKISDYENEEDAKEASEFLATSRYNGQA